MGASFREAIELGIMLKLDPSTSREVGNRIQTMGQVTLTFPKSSSKGLDDVTKSSQRASQNIKDLSRNIKTASSELRDFGLQSGLAFRRFLAFSIPAGAVFGTFAAARKGIKDAISFEREMIKIAQVSGQTLKGLSALEGQITSLSTEFGTSSADLLQATRQLKQAGISVTDIQKVLRTLAQTTLAPTFDDLKDTTEGAIAILAQFGDKLKTLNTGIEVKGVERLAADLGEINALSKAFAVESSDLIFAIKRAGGAFKSAGGNLQELLALFTAVRSTTRETAQTIATGLRTIIPRLQRPAGITFFREIGVELTELNKITGSQKFIGPFLAIQRISDVIKKLPKGDVRIARIVEQLGGLRQFSKVIPLLTQPEKILKALQVAQEGQNSLNEDSEVALQSLSVQLDRTREKFALLFRDIFADESLKYFLRSVLEITNALLDLSKQLTPLVPLIAGVFAFRGIRSAAKIAPGFISAFKSRRRVLGINPSRTALAKGGSVIGGAGGIDDIPALLTRGEFVINKGSAKKIGISNLRDLNRLNEGGAVGLAKGGTPTVPTGGLGGKTGGRFISQKELDLLFNKELFKILKTGDLKRAPAGGVVTKEFGRIGPGRFLPKKLTKALIVLQKETLGAAKHMGKVADRMVTFDSHIKRTNSSLYETLNTRRAIKRGPGVILGGSSTRVPAGGVVTPVSGRSLTVIQLGPGGNTRDQIISAIRRPRPKESSSTFNWDPTPRFSNYVAPRDTGGGFDAGFDTVDPFPIRGGSFNRRNRFRRGSLRLFGKGRSSKDLARFVGGAGSFLTQPAGSFLKRTGGRLLRGGLRAAGGIGGIIGGLALQQAFPQNRLASGAGGALAGGAIGFQLGGPVGAVIGALGGLVLGIKSASQAIKDEAINIRLKKLDVALSAVDIKGFTPDVNRVIANEIDGLFGDIEKQSPLKSLKEIQNRSSPVVILNKLLSSFSIASGIAPDSDSSKKETLYDILSSFKNVEGLRLSDFGDKPNQAELRAQAKKRKKVTKEVISKSDPNKYLQTLIKAAQASDSLDDLRKTLGPALPAIQNFIQAANDSGELQVSYNDVLKNMAEAWENTDKLRFALGQIIAATSNLVKGLDRISFVSNKVEDAFASTAIKANTISTFGSFAGGGLGGADVTSQFAGVFNRGLGQVDRRRFTAGARSVGTQFGFENIASDLIEADDAARKLSVAIQKYIDKGVPLVDATQDFSISTLMSGELGKVFDKLPPKFKDAFRIGIEGLSAGDLEKRVLQSGGTSEFVSEAAVRGGLGAVLLILGSTADRANAALNEWISTIISSTQTVSQATTAIFGVQTGRLGARQQFAANTGGTFNLDKFAQLFEKQQAELTRGLGVGGGLDPRSLGATARSLQNDIEVSKNILSGTAKLSNQDREAERQSLDSNFSKLERVNSALGRLANSTSLLSAAQEKLAREQDFNQFKSTIADIFTLGTPKERRNAAEGAITLGRFNSEFVSGRGLQFLDSLSARRKEIFRGFINLLPAKQQEEFKERQAEALGVPFETGAANEVLTLQLRAADAQEEAAKIQLQAANLQAVVANQKIEDAEQKIRLIPIRKPKYGYREPGDTLPRFPGDPFPSISEKKNSGGRLSGFGSRDTVPAMLTPGEFVINAGATRNNLGILQAINSGQNFARGGRVERQEREERRIARGERIKEKKANRRRELKERSRGYTAELRTRDGFTEGQLGVKDKNKGKPRRNYTSPSNPYGTIPDPPDRTPTLSRSEKLELARDRIKEYKRKRGVEQIETKDFKDLRVRGAEVKKRIKERKALERRSRNYTSPSNPYGTIPDPPERSFQKPRRRRRNYTSPSNPYGTIRGKLRKSTSDPLSPKDYYLNLSRTTDYYKPRPKLRGPTMAEQYGKIPDPLMDTDYYWKGKGSRRLRRHYEPRRVRPKTRFIPRGRRNYTSPSNPYGRRSGGGIIPRRGFQTGGAVTGGGSGGPNFESFTKSVERIGNSFGSFNKGVSDLSSAVGDFSNAVNKFTEAVGGIPHELNITGEKTLNINLNGGALLREIMPEITSMIQSEIAEALRDSIDTSMRMRAQNKAAGMKRGDRR